MTTIRMIACLACLFAGICSGIMVVGALGATEWAWAFGFGFACVVLIRISFWTAPD